MFGDEPSSQHIETKPEQSVRYPWWEADWLYCTFVSSQLKPRRIARCRAGDVDARIEDRLSEQAE
mgnify:CR=1 FL=1